MLSASPIDLTTLADLKAWCEISSNNTSEDSLLQSVITGFSNHVLLMTGRDSLNSQADYSECYDGNNSFRIFPRNSPIVSIASIQVNGVTVPASSGYGSAGYFIERLKNSIAIRSGNTGTFVTNYYPSNGLPFVFAAGVGNVLINYTAGYTPRTQTNESETIVGGTITLQYQGLWFADLGVTFQNGTPLLKVSSLPSAGQYSVSPSGIYQFNAADNSKIVLVSYTYRACPMDLEIAVKSAIQQWYKRRGTPDQKSKVISAGGGNSTISYRDWDLPPEVKIVINQYKRFSMS